MVLESNVTFPTDGIRLQVQNTHLFIENTDYGKGTLCVADSKFAWRLDNGQGLSFAYPQISLHAVSSDLNAFPHQCLYVMVEVKLLTNEESTEADDDEDEGANTTELRFVPDDKSKINPLFLAMNECQALHPDTQSNSEKGDEEEDDPNAIEEEYMYDDGGYQPLPSDDEDDDMPPQDSNNGKHPKSKQFEDAD